MSVSAARVKTGVAVQTRRMDLPALVWLDGRARSVILVGAICYSL